MINKNELRIGNYVNGELYETGYSVTVRQYKIKSLGEKIAVIQDRKTQSVLSYKEIQPILLTSEWLLKFGFKEHPISWSKDISYFQQSYRTICVTLSQGIIIREGGVMDRRSEDDICVLWNTDVRGPIMVHNLQNIYHALTGEELTIQE